MNSLGVEIQATAAWLEEHGAAGAATLLRRLAKQRDEAHRRLSEATTGLGPGIPQNDARGPDGQQRRPVDEECLQAKANAVLRRDNAMLRTDLARLQTMAERAGWVPDGRPRQLWRWRQGWWELSYRKRNREDGYRDSGWYLWGPDGSDGEWIAAHKADAMIEAAQLIAKHVAAAAAETKQ
ncbi:hypothetical protein ACFIN9_26635 [Streptomyces noursei]|uniref:hypothetical protein n=1 Tax=Streptomyces noursei TaxID=1971 RepID=UPI0036D23A8E